MGFEPRLPSILASHHLPGALEPELLLASGVKVMEKGERPSELTAKEELLASLGLREEEEEEEMEALLQAEGRSEALDVSEAVRWAVAGAVGRVRR